MEVFWKSNSVYTQDKEDRRVKSTSKDLKVIWGTLSTMPSLNYVTVWLDKSGYFRSDINSSFIYLIHPSQEGIPLKSCRLDSHLWFFFFLLPSSSTITGQEGGCRRNPAVSGWPPDSWLPQSQTNGPVCPRQLGSPQWHEAPLGSGCAACHRRWAAGHTGPVVLAGAQCLSFLNEKQNIVVI